MYLRDVLRKNGQAEPPPPATPFVTVTLTVENLRKREGEKQEKKGKEFSVSLPFLPPFSHPFSKGGQ